jgi:hypothetical protein
MRRIKNARLAVPTLRPRSSDPSDKHNFPKRHRATGDGASGDPDPPGSGLLWRIANWPLINRAGIASLAAISSPWLGVTDFCSGTDSRFVPISTIGALLAKAEQVWQASVISQRIVHVGREADQLQMRCMRGSRFESPQLHQEVPASGSGFPVPTIPRQFSALARKLMVCRVYSARTTGLGRQMRK